MKKRRKRFGGMVKVTITLFYPDHRGLAKERRPHFGVRRVLREAMAMLDCLESFDDGAEARIKGDGSETHPVGSVKIEPAKESEYQAAEFDRSEEARIAEGISNPIGPDGKPYDPRIHG